jgi:hypothetical protein
MVWIACGFLGLLASGFFLQNATLRAMLALSLIP